MTASFRALGDLLSPEFRSVLWQALGLTLLLFIAVLVGVRDAAGGADAVFLALGRCGAGAWHRACAAGGLLLPDGAR